MKQHTNNLYYLDDYHPYWSEYKVLKNPSFNQFSGLILDLKQEKDNGIQYFKNQILNWVPSNNINKKLILATAPSSNAEKLSSGIRVLAKELVKALPLIFIDGITNIVRTRTIPEKTRDYKLQYSSIKVDKPSIFKDSKVLLLDDVYTTGSTLKACHAHIKQCMPQKVYWLALGKTV